MIFCCSGFYYGVKYDKSDMTEENFRKAWNHPAARYFRRTVNKKGANPICAYCQSVDRFDPENNRRYYEIGAKADGDVPVHGSQCRFLSPSRPTAAQGAATMPAGRNPRILFLGNIAQNGYLATKFLRRAGYEADLLIYRYTHLMGQPEWEDAEILGNPPHFDAVWKDYVADEYRRPEWVREIRWPPRTLPRRALNRLRRAGLWPNPANNTVGGATRRRLAARFQERFGAERGPLQAGDIDSVVNYCNNPGIPAAVFRQYDLFIGAAYDAILPMLLAPGRPYLAFEHGTMRDLPFEDSAWGRLLALAYDQADACIITNPDCIASALRLGLCNFRFMPHPVDYKHLDLRPPPPLEQSLGIPAGPLVFAPARHDWDIKGNQEALAGFARFLAASGRSDVRLLLLEWGKEVERSRALIRQLGIERNVVWRPVLSGKAFRNALAAADVVLDQFVLGVFGSTVPQALAAGKPVVASYDETKNSWAFPVAPPLCRAGDAVEIAAQLRRLFDDPSQFRRLAAESRAWFHRHHSPDRVAEILTEMIAACYERKSASPPRAGQRRKPAVGALSA